MYNNCIKCGIVFTLLFLFFRCTDTQCSNENRFGPKCEFVCHCINSEECNKTSGYCPTACDFEWAGPACQHKNVVPSGSYENDNIMVVRHSSNKVPGQYAQLAVDRNLSTCSSTNYANMSREIPWFRLWMNKPHTIRNISIRTETEHLVNFKQFQVMVENNTAKHEGISYDDQQLCYQHNDSLPLSTLIEVKCSKAIYGNQIRIQLATVETQLVLCDVRVYGECNDGTYGVRCTDTCSPNCEDICDKDNGTCAKCLKGWRGNDCTQACADGKYGESCASTCSSFCRNSSTCNHIDGHCRLGCSSGFRGEKCDEKCLSGTYGIDCEQRCSEYCFQKTFNYCSHVSGSCAYGCEAGFKGTHCNEQCRSNSWGMNCNQSCGSCSEGEGCDTRNGFCANGCLPGFKSTNMCKEECSSGSFGTGCKQNCSKHCYQEELDYCSHVSGRCVYGCESGFKGAYCNEACSSNEWGMNCDQSCGSCSKGDSCDTRNGFCVNGCMPGYKTTLMCAEECQIGSYGDNCAGNCSLFCNDKDFCNRIDGTCQKCVAGWTGVKCDTECQNGFYGAGCSLQCGNCKPWTVCNGTTGVCHEGCSAGFVGEMCDAVQEQATDASIHLSPAALAGIIITFVILIAISIFVTFFVTRKIMELSRKHNAPESEAVYYSNVLAAETSTRDGATDYETLNRKNGSEHIYG